MPRFRVGSVPYLNARPLIDGLSDVELHVPSELAARFEAGHLDVALLPAFEALRREHAIVVDDVAIAGDGEVYSVFLAHRGALESGGPVALDPSSLTSSHLLRIIFLEFLGFEPVFTPGPTDPLQPRLLIGDPAMAFRAEHADGWEFLDLSAAWKDHTGLPFVFACWVMRDGISDPRACARELRRIKHSGLEHRKSIAGAEPDPAFAFRYLTEFIRFDLGPKEKESMNLFADFLRKHRLVENPPVQLEFI